MLYGQINKTTGSKPICFSSHVIVPFPVKLVRAPSMPFTNIHLLLQAHPALAVPCTALRQDPLISVRAPEPGLSYLSFPPPPSYSRPRKSESDYQYLKLIRRFLWRQYTVAASKGLVQRSSGVFLPVPCPKPSCSARSSRWFRSNSVNSSEKLLHEPGFERLYLSVELRWRFLVQEHFRRSFVCSFRICN